MHRRPSNSVDNETVTYIMNIFCAAQRYGSNGRACAITIPGMNIVVSQVSEAGGLRLHHLYPEGEPDLAGFGGRIVGRSELDMRATRVDKKVELIGALNANVGFECDRCLTRLSIPVAQSFALVYAPPMGTGDENELAEDDLSVAFYQGDAIDVDDLVREQIELALPMSRLCREDCRGLCPDCGADLNEDACSCTSKNVDSRWAALSEFESRS